MVAGYHFSSRSRAPQEGDDRAAPLRGQEGDDRASPLRGAEGVDRASPLPGEEGDDRAAPLSRLRGVLDVDGRAGNDECPKKTTGWVQTNQPPR